MSWGVPIFKPYYKVAFLILYPMYAVSMFSFFTTVVMGMHPKQHLRLMYLQTVISWVLLITAIIVLVDIGQFREFCTDPDSLFAPVLRPDVCKPTTRQAGRLALSMPLTSPIFEEPDFLRRMVQDFVIETEGLAVSGKHRGYTESEGGDPIGPGPTTASTNRFNSI